MVEKVETYCLNILEKGRCKKLPFHDALHTLEVVENVQLISRESGIVDYETESLIIAAWFHDTGFAKVYHEHEEVSKQFAMDFLKEQNYGDAKINAVTSYIAATKMPQNPSTYHAEILCDADCFHLSTPNFFYRTQLLRKEWEKELEQCYTDIDWHKLNLNFLENHAFFTEYGKNELIKGKQENIRKILKLIEICF